MLCHDLTYLFVGASLVTLRSNLVLHLLLIAREHGILGFEGFSHESLVGLIH